MSAVHRLARTSTRYTTATVQNVPFTQEELDVLEALTWHVGGSPSGARGVVDQIADKVRPLATPRERKNGRTFTVVGSMFLEWQK